MAYRRLQFGGSVVRELLLTEQVLAGRRELLSLLRPAGPTYVSVEEDTHANGKDLGVAPSNVTRSAEAKAAQLAEALQARRPHLAHKFAVQLLPAEQPCC